MVSITLQRVGKWEEKTGVRAVRGILGGEEWKCGGVGCKKGQRNSPKRHLHVWLTSCPLSHGKTLTTGEIRSVVTRNFPLSGKAPWKKLQWWGEGEWRGEQDRASARGRGWQRHPEKMKNREEMASLIEDRGAFAWSLWHRASSPPPPCFVSPPRGRGTHREDEWKAD